MDTTAIIIFLTSLFSAIGIWSAHKYLEGKLGERNDNAYLYMAAAFASWSLMALVELFDVGDKFRTVLSAFNNALIVLSLSFIGHGWDGFSRKVQKLGLIPIAVFITLTSLLANIIDDHWFARIDAFWSVSIMVALSIGFSVTFFKRKVVLMPHFSCLTGIFFIVVQILELHNKGHLNWASDFIANDTKSIVNILRITTRLMLAICTLLLSLSWLGIGGIQRKKTVTDESPSSALFRETHKISDDDLEILKRLAEGETMPQIAKGHRRYKGDGDKLQSDVVKRLAHSFKLPSEKYIGVVLYAIQNEILDIKNIKIK